AGPCKADIHYMLSPTERLPDVKRLIAQHGYFVIHAPRQIGKTTAMLALAQELTASGDYTAVMVSAEVGSGYPNDSGQAETAILRDWYDTSTFRLPPALHPPEHPRTNSGGQIGTFLKHWAQSSPRPLVVFIDEIDALRDDTLIAVLRQFRDGYPNRPNGFPQSLALVGLRDVRDYKVAAGGSQRLGTTSPFNIKVKSLTMRNFTAAEVAQLYQQHTDLTGQIFAPAVLQQAFELSQGQPWLVNALAKEMVEELVPDITQPLTLADLDQAKENLIERNDTHLDSLAERLKEERIRAIIEPMLAGQDLGEIPADDRQFAIDLGLVCRHPAGGLAIANPIYREVLPRMLAGGPRDALPLIAPTWLNEAGKLIPEALLEAFLKFWRQHGQPLLKSASYHEIAPHLVLMAFLHRVVNGGGTLEREYAIASRRMDLCLRYGEVTIGIELKVWRDGRPDPLPEGLEQLDAYLAGLSLDWGWLIIFDRREGLPDIAERTTTEAAETASGRRITVIRG
ncbi:MAG: ATP-binding protein, partial [Spirulinaceae cyanobacterium SM2_1_0]|nr:ATP-binding protein [Spirulinaceae cyanobacterium SM2_1_0]